MALAYFLTFTTYGTWLHGSRKGKGSVDRHHNTFGEAFVEADAAREAVAARTMQGPRYVMDAPRRRIVREAIAALCREKGWRLRALHVRADHVHAVVSAEREAGRLMSDLKARASRELNRAGLEDADVRRWTRHGSTRHLFDEASCAAAIRYTLEGQGEPMETFDGRRGREGG